MRSKKIAFVFSCLAILGLISLYFGPRTKTQYQADYENWLNTTLSARQSLIRQGSVPAPITVSLSNTAPGTGFNWSYTSSPEPESEEQLQRILNLIRDSDLMALSRDGLSTGPYKLEISTEQKKFRLYFSEPDVENNLRAQNLLKLLQIYAMNRSGLGGSQLAKSDNAESSRN